MNSHDFLEILKAEWPQLAPQAAARVAEFRERVLRENEVQNLTKLTSPSDFYFGHVADVKAFLDCPWVSFPALDIGSGGGVPGVLSALLSEKPWVVSDSEGRKAAFLAKTVEEMGLSAQVRVVSGRAEDFLAKLSAEKAIQSVVARAVGPVHRIYGWIRKCSTWNNLILFKGPGWAAEWEKFGTEYRKPELKVVQEYAYQVGPEQKQRVILRLDRVPRGTISNKR